MKKSTVAWLAFSFCHLILVLCGAFQLDLGKWLHRYGDITGSGSGYGFFSPGVGYQVRAEFDVLDKNGEVKTTSLLSGKNREGDLRTGNVITSFSRNSQEEKVRRALVASWA